MMENSRFAWAVTVSVVAHGGVLAWLVDPPDARKAPVQLQVVLIRPVSEVPAAAQAPALRPKTPSADRGASRDDPDPRTSVDPLLVRPEARTPLNLERPAQWDDLLGDTAGSASTRGEPPNLAFTPSLAAALATRDTARRRQILGTGRAAAVYGVADDAYVRQGPRGNEIKMDGRCMTLVEDRSVERGVRWWPGTCTESRTDPMVLEPPEYDRLGRLIVD